MDRRGSFVALPGRRRPAPFFALGKTTVAVPSVPGEVDVRVCRDGEGDALRSTPAIASFARPARAHGIQIPVQGNGDRNTRRAPADEASLAGPAIAGIRQIAVRGNIDRQTLSADQAKPAIARPSAPIGRIHCVRVRRHFDGFAPSDRSPKSTTAYPTCIIVICRGEITVGWDNDLRAARDGLAVATVALPPLFLNIAAVGVGRNPDRDAAATHLPVALIALPPRSKLKHVGVRRNRSSSARPQSQTNHQCGTDSMPSSRPWTRSRSQQSDLLKLPAFAAISRGCRQCSNRSRKHCGSV